eukprot:31125-Pelagococcus_subviridis.AAC.40
MSGDLAFTYAALILSDDGQEVTADKMDTIVKAAGVTVEPYWGMLFGKFLATKSVDELVANVGAGACAALDVFVFLVSPSPLARPLSVVKPSAD